MENIEYVVSSSVYAVGILLGVGSLGVTISLGMIGSNASSAIGRNPEAKNDILQTSLIIGLMSFIVLIILLLIAAILLFANPFLV